MSVEKIIEFAKGKEYDCYGRLLFEGEFVNGEPSKGIFKKYFEDKIVFEGELLKGKIWNGKGMLYDFSGYLRFEGEYKNGFKEGYIKEYYYDSRLIFEGEYLKGKKSGKAKEYGDKGELIFEGQYFDDIRWNGKGKEFN